MSAGRFSEPDPEQRIQNALEDEEGQGGPFTKAQQQEKVQRQGDQQGHRW